MYSSKTLADRLKEQGAELIESADAPELHARAHIDGFEALEGDAGYIEQVAHICRVYASAPIVHDAFGKDHDSRRAWRESLPNDLRTCVLENKMRANSILGVVGHLMTFLKMLTALNIHSKEAERARAIFSRMPESVYAYHSLPEEEKARVVKELDGICREFLRLVTKMPE
jgi:hypothetical protein